MATKHIELEKQVCSLEIAKRLKEHGVKQESAFYWDAEGRVEIRPDLTDWYDGQDGADETVAAFTVAELGEMLPSAMEFTCFAGNSDEGTLFHITMSLALGETLSFSEGTEADARAKMLVYLIENGFLPAAA